MYRWDEIIHWKPKNSSGERGRKGKGAGIGQTGIPFPPNTVPVNPGEWDWTRVLDRLGRKGSKAKAWMMGRAEGGREGDKNAKRHTSASAYIIHK